MGRQGCPQCGPHYLTEVNKGQIKQRYWQNHLIQMYAQGHKLFIAFEQAGNTVQVDEHRRL